MNPHDIFATLKKKGYSQTHIARELKVSQAAISHVIYSRSRSIRIARHIAKKTGLSVCTLWPGMYQGGLIKAH